MKPESRSLSFALGVSLLIHGLPFLAALAVVAPPPPAPAPLQAQLQATPSPELRFKEVRTENETPPPPPKPKLAPLPANPASRNAVSSPKDMARQAQSQISKNLLYPVEAVNRGLEGETLVTLFFDEKGNAMAARVEVSSGHGILDEAAVRAARMVKGLPEAASREVSLPVRFRLR